jgi:hypothetical protein
MKLNQLLLLGATSLFVATLPIVSYAGGLKNDLTRNNQAQIFVAQKQTVALASGEFVAAEKPTTGISCCAFKLHSQHFLYF